MSFDYKGFGEHQVAPRLDDHVGEVYVLVFKNDTAEVPFYVGQTRRFLGRMDDYFWADFQAATDFKVGMAIKYFYSQPSGRVVARHKLVPDPPAEEKVILAEFKCSKTPLLNGVAYDYRTAVLKEVLDQVHIRCREILSHAGIDALLSDMIIAFPTKPGIIAYLTAGDPHLTTARDIALADIAEERGAR